MMVMCNRECKTTSLLVTSIAAMVVAILAKWVAVPLVIENQVYKNLELIEGTTGYDVWLEPPNEIWMKYYFYHVSNPDEIKSGAKPIVIQIGPYVYKEFRKKENVIPIGDEELFYGQHITYFYDQGETEAQGCVNPLTNNSACSSRDELTVINSALIGAVDMIHSLPELPLPGNFSSDTVQTTTDLFYSILNQLLLAEDALFPDDLFHTFAVDDLLWQGHTPGIIKFFYSIIDIVKLMSPTYLGFELDLEKYLPPQIANGTLAFFRGKNATTMNNYYKINRGRNEKHKFCHIQEMNGKSELPSWWWPDLPATPNAQKSGAHGTCNMLHGTDGVFFTPLMDKNYPIWLFVSDLCRSVYATYESETEVKGLPAWRYRASTELIKYSHPENLCFCPAFRKCAKPDPYENKWDLSDCEEPCQDGTLHATGCFGVPVVLTAPHFFNSAKSLIEGIEGMNPDIDKHDTYLDVEPITGVTLSAFKRGQINVQLRPVATLSGFEIVRKVVFPVFWAEEGAVIDDKNVDLYKSMVSTPLFIVDIFVYTVGFAFSSIGIIVSIIFKVKLRNDRRKMK